jgi:hypothetical protein
MGLAAGQYFLPVTRALLTAASDVPVLDVFRHLGVPKSPGYRILAFYEAHNAVQNAPGHLAVDVRRVVTLAGGLRADRAVPDRTLAAGPPLEVALRLVRDAGVPHALGFQSAANEHAYFEPAGVHQWYVDRQRRASDPSALPDVAARLAEHPQASPRNRYEFFLDDLARLDVQDRSGRPAATSPVQTLLDLAVHARTAAHLEFMLGFLGKQGLLHG